MVTQKLVESLGQTVRDRIVSLIDGRENWPENGVAAGQAVASLVWEALGMGKSVINDIDFFVPEYRSVDGVRKQPIVFGQAEMSIEPESYSRYETVLGAKAYREYRVIESVRKNVGKTELNIVKVSVADESMASSAEAFTRSLLRAFDFNAVCVAVSKEGKLFFEEVFLNFLKNRQLEIYSVHTPVQTYVRAMKKYRELGAAINGGVYLSEKELARACMVDYAIEMLEKDFAIFFDSVTLPPHDAVNFLLSIAETEEASPYMPPFMYLLKWTIRQSSFRVFGEKSKESIDASLKKILSGSTAKKFAGLADINFAKEPCFFHKSVFDIAKISAHLASQDKKSFGRDRLYYANSSIFWTEIKYSLPHMERYVQNRQRNAYFYVRRYSESSSDGEILPELLSVFRQAYLDSAKKLRKIGEPWAIKLRKFLALFVRTVLKKSKMGSFFASIEKEGHETTMAIFHFNVADIVNMIFALSESSLFKIRETGKIISHLFVDEEFYRNEKKWTSFLLACTTLSHAFRPEVFRNLKGEHIALASKVISKFRHHRYFATSFAIRGTSLTLKEMVEAYRVLQFVSDNLKKNGFEGSLDMVIGLMESFSIREEKLFLDLRKHILNGNAQHVLKKILEKQKTDFEKVRPYVVLEKPVYNDRFYVAQLYTPIALNKEGTEMSHCVGGYMGLIESGEHFIFSLKDKKKNVRLTMELTRKPDENGNMRTVLSQLYKKRNVRPTLLEAGDILDFFTSIPEIKKYFGEVETQYYRIFPDQQVCGVEEIEIGDPDVPF